MAGKNQGNYAGFWIRFCALFIDALILFIPNLLLELGVKLALSTALHIDSDPNTAPLSALAISIAVQITTGILYFVILQTRMEGTFGKKVLGLRIVTANHKPVRMGQMAIRYVMTIVNAILLCLGYFAVGISATKQGWHDHVAGTLVIKRTGKTQSTRARTRKAA